MAALSQNVSGKSQTQTRRCCTITLQYSLYSLKCQCYHHIMLASLENTNSKDIGEFVLGYKSKWIWGPRPRGGIHINLCLPVLPAAAKLIIKPIQLSCNPSKKSEIQSLRFFNARTQTDICLWLQVSSKTQKRITTRQRKNFNLLQCNKRAEYTLLHLRSFSGEWLILMSSRQSVLFFSIHTNTNHPWAQLSVRLQRSRRQTSTQVF